MGCWWAPLFKAGRLLTFSAFRMDAYLRWVLIRGWVLIPINTVCGSTPSAIVHVQPFSG